MAIDYAQDGAGIVTLTIDMAERRVNLLDERFLSALEAALDRLAADASIAGVILTSGKPLFMAGADIDMLLATDGLQAHFDRAQQVKALLRRLETLGKPVVAALNGTALGAGFELALACHYRVALDDDRLRVGFPEVGLGLLPGAGGVVRTGRLLGLQKALEWLTQNQKYTPRQALAAGMIHALAPDVDDLLAQARAWIAANLDARAPWDTVKGYKIPGGDPSHPALAQLLALGPAIMRQETKGNYPAPQAILSALVEGAQVDFDTASRIESRYFAKLASGQVSKNMIAAFWTQLNQIKKGAARPQHVARQQTTKVGVLGAGMMGHGIAAVSALAGMDVILIDVTREKAAQGLEKSAAIMTKRVQRGAMSREQADIALARISPTSDYAQLGGCDLVVEAVDEDHALKSTVIAQAETARGPQGILASNTATLPITSLAAATAQPAKFIGLHFIPPVHKMRLLEIIVGDHTDDQTLAHAFDYALAIGKVPIVVNDSPGFYTSRVVATWIGEGLALLAEGQQPQAIEMAGLQAGLPLGPLALLDEISLTLAARVHRRTPSAHPTPDVLQKMLARGRTGRAAGGGFYDYEAGDRRLWPQLGTLFPLAQQQLSQAEMVDRILFIQAHEAARCLEEGVVRTVADANLGSILGWGFAPFHGGTLQFINAYGVGRFVRRAQALAETYGPRFAPPQSLLTMADDGTIFQ